jgi:hypothetical protein
VLVVAGLLLLIVCLIGLHILSQGGGNHFQPWSTIGLAVGTVLVGIATIRALGDIVADRTVDYLGVVRSRSLRSVVSAILYVLLALAVASQTNVNLSGLALSTAVTGVVVGIAAQASIANVVAGLVILFARPFRPGQFVTVRAAAFAGSEYSGVVGEITLFYTTLFCGAQEIRVPNSSMITSVVTLRPQLIDVYLPVILTPAQWANLSTTDLAQRLTAALPAGRTVTVAVERVDAGNVQLGIRTSVASDAERGALERALATELGSAVAVDATEDARGTLEAPVTRGKRGS